MRKSFFTRESYIPQGATKVALKGSDAVVYLSTDKRGRPYAVAFAGRGQKPIFNEIYRSEKSREERVRGFFENQKQLAAYKAERKAKKSAPSTLQPGSILNTCWGYNMTRVEFYRVVERVSDHFVTIEELPQIVVSGSAGYTGTCLPDLSAKPTGKTKRYKVVEDAIKIHDSARATKWDGSPCSFNYMD